LALLYIVFYGLFGYKTGDKELDLY
jgi:hypothetical protein